MNFYEHRPAQHEGRGDSYWPEIIDELTQMLVEAQKDFAHESLCLPGRQFGELAHILVEFAEDIHNNIGLWSSLERYNLDFFGTPLPLILPADKPAPTASLEDRICYLLWVLYPDIEPDLILGPVHQDLRLLAGIAADFLADRMANVPKQSGVKQFLDRPNRFGWEVKRKLVWLGQHSYLFRLSFQNYVADHGGVPDIATIDDFICQETTAWSGLGVIDILAGTLPLSKSQRATLRGWYERHLAYYQVRAAKGTILKLVNLINNRPYNVKLDQKTDVFKAGEILVGGLLPWGKAWYWSGEQRLLGSLPAETIEEISQDMIKKASQVVYRYHPEKLAQAQDSVQRHYRAFMEYHGDDLVIYPDGLSMAADMQRMFRLRNEQVPERERAEIMETHGLDSAAPKMPYPPEIINTENGVGVYFNRSVGTEMMIGFDDVINGLKKRGYNLTENEEAAIQGFIESEAISPRFVQRVVQDYGAESIAAAFLIRNFQDHPYYLDYLLRRYKGHFYRKRYPQVTLVD